MQQSMEFSYQERTALLGQLLLRVKHDPEVQLHSTQSGAAEKVQLVDKQLSSLGSEVVPSVDEKEGFV